MGRVRPRGAGRRLFPEKRQNVTPPRGQGRTRPLGLPGSREALLAVLPSPKPRPPGRADGTGGVWGARGWRRCVRGGRTGGEPGGSPEPRQEVGGPRGRLGNHSRCPCCPCLPGSCIHVCLPHGRSDAASVAPPWSGPTGVPSPTSGRLCACSWDSWWELPALRAVFCVFQMEETGEPLDFPLLCGRTRSQSQGLGWEGGDLRDGSGGAGTGSSQSGLGVTSEDL